MKMGTAYSPADAQTFVESYADSPIKGDPSHTLANYINTHIPAWGVIVNPAIGVDVLVWYDASNRLHVVESPGADVAASIAAPPYHTNDESVLYNIADNATKMASGIGGWLAQIPNAIPSPSTIVTIAVVAAGIYLWTLLPHRRH
jgi:hypothetical protein